MSAASKREAARAAVEAGLCTRRQACRYLGLHRSSFGYRQREAATAKKSLAARVVALSRDYPRYGYRRVRALLLREGWKAGRKFVQKVRRLEGLGVSRRKPRRRRQGRTTGWPDEASVPNEVWSWDFVHDRTDNGVPLRMLTLIDEYTRQCLAVRPARRLGSKEVLDVLAEVIAERGAPEFLRSDNGPEFISKEVQAWLGETGIATCYIEPGSPWQNGHVESFHNRLRDECLDREVFLSVLEARVVIEEWRRFYNRVHPHSSLGFQSPDEYAKTGPHRVPPCAPATPPLRAEPCAAT